MILPLSPNRPSLPILSVVAVWAAATLLLLSQSAAAAEPPKKASPAARQGAKKSEPVAPEAKPAETLLTRDQLRACMALQASNKQRNAEMARMQSELVAQTDQVKRDGEALRTDLTALDRSNADAVAAYNLRVADRTRQVVDFEAKVADFNARVQSVDQGRADYARGCEDRKFDERDEKALLKGS